MTIQGEEEIRPPLRVAEEFPSEVTVIAPRRAWELLDFRELWAYRELLLVLVGRDVRVRYKQTALGASWAVLRPLLSMVIFTVVFGKLAKLPSDGAPYPLFVFSALLPWTFFSTASGAAADSLVGAQGMISKIYFPRLIIPLATLGVALVDLGVGFLMLLILALVYGFALGAGLLLLPVALLLLLMSTLGVATLLSALTVSYRDFRHVAPFLLQLWMYATPVVYSASLVPEHWRWALYINPATGAIDAFRAAILGLRPDVLGLATSLTVSAVILVGAVLYFSRVERRFADIV